VSWCRAPIWNSWPDFSVLQLRFSWCWTPSLTKELICYLFVQLLLGLASAVTLGFMSRRNQDHLLLSLFKNPPTWRTRRPYLYPQEQGGLIISSGTGFPFNTYDSHGYGGGILIRLHTDSNSSYNATDGQSASSSWCRAPFEAHDQIWIVFVQQFFSSSCNVPYLTKGRVSHFQCNHAQVGVAQDPWPYIIVSSETPPALSAKSPYLCPPGTGFFFYWLPFLLCNLQYAFSIMI
jgi:hypothetical protein